MKKIFIIIIAASMLNLQISSLPIKLKNDSQAIWIDSTTLRDFIGDTIVTEFEKKGEFTVNAPYTVLQMLADLFVIGHAIHLTKVVTQSPIMNQIGNYLKNTRKDVDLSDLVNLISVAQQFFPPIAVIAIMKAVAQLAGQLELDLSETDISEENQIIFASYQRLENMPEHSVKAFLTYLPINQLETVFNNNELNLSRTTIQRFVPFALASIIGIHNFTQSLEVKKVDLSYNQLRFDKVDNDYMNNTLHNVEQIILSNNSLTSLPEGFFSGLKKLTVVEMDHNNITALPSDFLTKNSLIQHVDLSHNQLESLPENFLENATQLKKIYLNANQLTQLPTNFLRNAPDTVELYLAANNFTDDYLRDLPIRIQKMIKDIPQERFAKRKRELEQLIPEKKRKHDD